MDPNLQTWLWLAGGAALVASEFVAPGLVAAFFGAGALTTAALRGLGLIESTPLSVLVFAGSSAAYLLLLRGVLARRFGEGEKTTGSTSEDVRAFGQLVEVIEDVVEGEATGRVRYEGTSWPAKSEGGTLRAGTKARLLHRDNIGWVVESAEGAPELDPVPERKKLH